MYDTALYISHSKKRILLRPDPSALRTSVIDLYKMDWFSYEKYSAELKGIHIIFHTLSLMLAMEGYLVKDDHRQCDFWKESKDGGNPWSFTTLAISAKLDDWELEWCTFTLASTSIGHTYSRLYSIPLHLGSPFIKSPMYGIDPKMPSEHRVYHTVPNLHFLSKSVR